MEETSKKPIRGIKIRTINLWMILVSCVLYLLLIFATVHASACYTDMVASTREYITCEENASLVTQGSDFLTEQVRLFAVTADPQYLAAYFREVNETRRRDTSLAQLKEYQVEEESLSYLQLALDNSNSLMEQEIYAMKLTAAAHDLDISAYPEVDAAKLSREDLSLDCGQKIRKAQDMVFGSGYQSAKALIAGNISYLLH